MGQMEVYPVEIELDASENMVRMRRRGKDRSLVEDGAALREAWVEGLRELPGRLRKAQLDDDDRRAWQARKMLLPEDLFDKFSEALARLEPGTQIQINLSVKGDEKYLHLPWELISLPVFVGGDRRHNANPPEIGRRLLLRHPQVSLFRHIGAEDRTRDHGGRKVGVCIATSLHGRLTGPDGRVVEIPDASDPGWDLVDQLQQVDGGRLPAYQIGPARPNVVDLCRGLSDGTFGLVYFGHHLEGQGLVLAAQGDPARFEVIAAKDLGEVLVGAGVQWAVLAACRSAVMTGDSGSFASSLVRSGVPVVVAMQGDVNSLAASAFLRAFLGNLTDSGDVGQALAAGQQAMPDAEAVLPAIYTSRHELTVLRPALRGARKAIGWWAHWVPAGWTPGAVKGATDRTETISDRLKARLDVLWGLDRTALTSVVADLPGADLAYALNDMERYAYEASDRPKRRWFKLNGRAPAPDSLRSLARAIDDPAWEGSFEEDEQGRRIGIVVALTVDGAGDLAAFAGARSLAELRDHELSGGALVYQITAADNIAAILAADRLGTVLAQTAGGSRLGCTVLTRVTHRLAPNEFAAPEPVPGEVLAPVVGELARQLRSLGLAPEWDAPVGPSAPPGAGKVPVLPAHEMAERLVDELNAGVLPVGLDERRFLRLVGELMPRYRWALLRRHCVFREGRARYAGLAAAVDFDNDLREWLTGVDESAENLADIAGRVPTDWVDRDAMDTIGLWLRDMGKSAATVKEWLGRGGGEILEIVEQLDSAMPTRRPADLISPATVAPLRRCGVLGRIADLQAWPALTLEAQAALIHQSAMSPELLAAVSGLPSAAQRLLGFDPSADVDSDDADRLHAVRQILRPTNLFRRGSNAG